MEDRRWYRALRHLGAGRGAVARPPAAGRAARLHRRGPRVLRGLVGERFNHLGTELAGHAVPHAGPGAPGVRRYKQAHGPQTILVRIAGGLYQLTGPVVFTAEDSGWENMPIQYVAWNPDFFDNPYQDDVLFSGGIVVGGWQPAVTPFGVQAYVSQQLDVVEIRDLWVNNCRMVKARFPNVPEPCPPQHV